MDVLVHGISGSISGLTAISVWYPLEILRMREQIVILENSSNSEEQGKESNLSNPSKLKEESTKYFENLKIFFISKMNSVKFASEIISKEGISSLYNGMSSALVGSVISSGLYFLAYKYFKDLLVDKNFTKGIVIDSMITSFLASCCTAIGSNPIWVLNARMSKSKKETGSVSNLQMIQQIVKEEGIGAFFKGLIPSLFLTANPVINFIIYELLRIRLLDTKGNISAVNIIIISIISKLITTLVTYPMLTIKTLFQSNENKTNPEIFEILKKLFKDEGVKGFYKGKI